jgi:hypothetical protein
MAFSCIVNSCVNHFWTLKQIVDYQVHNPRTGECQAKTTKYRDSRDGEAKGEYTIAFITIGTESCGISFDFDNVKETRLEGE